MADVVSDDPRIGQREGRIAEAGRERGRRGPIGRRRLPQTPGGRRPFAYGSVRVPEGAVIGVDDVAAAQSLGQGAAPSLPRLGEEEAQSVAKEPVELFAPAGRDAEEHECADVSGKTFGVGQRQSATPRSAEDQPVPDAEVRPEPFDVGDQVVGGVARQVRVGRTGVGAAASAVALIEEDDVVPRRIEELALPRRTAGARAAVEHEGGPALRIAAGLPVDQVAAADVQHAVGMGLDGGIQAGHAVSARSSVTPADRPRPGRRRAAPRRSSSPETAGTRGSRFRAGGTGCRHPLRRASRCRCRSRRRR